MSKFWRELGVEQLGTKYKKMGAHTAVSGHPSTGLLAPGALRRYLALVGIVVGPDVGRSESRARTRTSRTYHP